MHSGKSLEGAVSLPDILGVSNDEFVKVYGQRRKRKVHEGHHPFSFFRIYEYNSHATGTGTACNTSATPRVAAAAPPVTPTAPTVMSMKELLVKITDDLRKMNLSDERDLDEALVKTCHHAGYELLTLLDDAQDGTPKGTVYLTRSTGGTPATYVKCQRLSQGGDSERSIYRKKQKAKVALKEVTGGMSNEAKDKVISSASTDTLSPFFFI
jgi:hypothetical protein